MSETSGDPQPSGASSYALGETDVPPPATAVAPRRRSRGNAHLTSVVLCLVLTAIALGALDYALVSGWSRSQRLGVDEAAPTKALVGMGIAAGLLLVVAALSRLSGLGPLVAGLVWGVLPAVGFALVPATMTKRMIDLSDVYDRFLLGLVTTSSVFPVLGGLLVGVGLFGRWRGAKTEPAVRAGRPGSEVGPRG